MLKKRLEILRLLVNYLETSLTEAFVKSEISRLERVMSAKIKIFDDKKEGYIEKGLTPKQISGLKSKHEALYDIKKMRTHVRNLRILLK